MTAADWGKVIAPVLVAVFAAVGVSQGNVSDQQFQRVAAHNCDEINHLKGTLREILLLVPDDGEDSQEFLDRALSLLEPTDCNDLVE